MTVKHGLMVAGVLLVTAVRIAFGQAVAWSEESRLELRENYAGRLVRGTVILSPKAEEAEGTLTVDGNSVQPVWNSATVADGARQAKLTAAGKSFKATLNVLNDPRVIIHGGELKADETWGADKIHVIRDWVRIPKGRTLVITENAIVKFCDGTGIRVDGTLKALNVNLTSIHDDSLGGDTDQNGPSQTPPGAPRYEIVGDGAIQVQKHQTAEGESGFGRLENRTDYGGRLVRGQIRISPVDKAVDPQVTLNIENQPAGGWSATQPQWQSTQVSDGWHDATLNEQGAPHMEKLAVLNDEKIMVHGGVLESDETWGADKVHVVRNWVRIPVGMTLTIEAGTVVKICAEAGIRVDGTLIAREVIFTAADDDTVGGDTDLDGDKADGGKVDLIVNGNADLTDSDIRNPDGISQNLIWTGGSVHVIHGTMTVPAGKTLTLEAGAVVKLATGAKLVVADGGGIVCESVTFTHLPDDTIGGDSEQNGDATRPEHDQYKLAGFLPPESCDLRYYSLVYAGWNLIAPGADIPDSEANRGLLEQYCLFGWGGECYQRPLLPIIAGDGLWIYSRKPQVVSFEYGNAGAQGHRSLEKLPEGWSMIGVPGESGLRLALNAGDCVWQWNGQGYELVRPEADGQVLLRSGRGYFIYHVPEKGPDGQQ